MQRAAHLADVGLVPGTSAHHVLCVPIDDENAQRYIRHAAGPGIASPPPGYPHVTLADASAPEWHDPDAATLRLGAFALRDPQASSYSFRLIATQQAAFARLARRFGAVAPRSAAYGVTIGYALHDIDTALVETRLDRLRSLRWIGASYRPLCVEHRISVPGHPFAYTVARRWVIA